MKIVELKLYSFNELSDEAKQKALSDYNGDSEYFWGDEAMGSLKKFLEHFNCELIDWSLDFLEPHRNSYKIDIPEYMQEKTYDELKGYIEGMGKYDPETLKGLGSCMFTGVCFDESLGDGARKEYYSGTTGISDIIHAGISEWEIDVKKDCEYNYSEECYAETCESNEYLFTEEGQLWS